MKRYKLLPVLGFIAAIALSPVAYCKQLALVIGIDRYPSLSKNKQLNGAVNDAMLIANGLRAKGVDLPDNRLLLNENATSKNFINQFQGLLASAQTGDELIITFAGHGGQEEERAEPLDEADHKDETLMFSDFVPESSQGRISDDELYSLLASARLYSVLFVADTCHSGGISRAASIKSEFASRGILDIYTPHFDSTYQLPAESDKLPLSHVTYLAATENEQLEIKEYHDALDDKTHGALSTSFAKAIKGYADSDSNQIITRKELKQYISTEVKKITDNRQLPGLLPRGDSYHAFTMASIEKIPEPLPNQVVAIKLEGGVLPAGVLAVREDASQYVLRFIFSDKDVTAYNPLGDKLTSFKAADVNAWNKLIAKYRFLSSLDTFEQKADGVSINLPQGDGLHKLDEVLNFEINFATNQPFIFLFNLAGSGEWQSLYPLLSTDKSKQSSSPFHLPLSVKIPTGKDDMVAVSCINENPTLKKIMEDQDGKSALIPEIFFTALGENCSVGRYAFFSTDN